MTTSPQVRPRCARSAPKAHRTEPPNECAHAPRPVGGAGRTERTVPNEPPTTSAPTTGAPNLTHVDVPRSTR